MATPTALDPVISPMSKATIQKPDMSRATPEGTPAPAAWGPAGVTGVTTDPAMGDANPGAAGAGTPAGSNPGAASYDPSGVAPVANAPGVLSGAMPATPTVTPTSIAGSTPTTTAASATGTNWSLDPNKQTVQGQLSGILAANSPLMQQAAARSQEQQIANGTLNSSMAVGAAQGAVMDKAMSIATQDANTYAANAKYAADTANSTSQFNTGQANQVGVQNTAEQNQNIRADQTTGLQGQVANQDVAKAKALAGFDSATKLAMQNTDTAGKLQLSQIDSNTKQAIEQMDAQYKIQMQTSNSMALTYQSMISEMSKVMADQNMDGPSKATAIENLRQMYSDSLAVQSQVSGLKLGSIISPTSFGDVGGGSNSPTPGAPGNAPPPAPAPAPPPSNDNGSTGGT